MSGFLSTTQAVPEDRQVPQHVAIIMDGNGRWAKARGMPRTAGHVRGEVAVRRTVEACASRGVKFLTLFAFSSENWRRPPDEVALLMKLFGGALERRVVELESNGIRLRFIGDLSAFQPSLRSLMDAAVARTEHNTRMTLTIAVNYGGRWDMLQAVRAMLTAHPEFGNDPSRIDESALAPYLAMAHAPEPDLFIRTGGEQRISNFLLWQLAYTELYFTDAWWPDFGPAALDAAIASFRERERRFGRTSAQVSASS